MIRLIVQQNRVSYAALFTRPAFSLWGKGPFLLDGLFNTFSKHGVTLANLRFEQESREPATQAIIVSFSPSCYYKVQLDRVESVLEDYLESDMEIFPDILREGADWLRASIPSFAFQSHLFTYFAHSKLIDGSGREVLSAIPTMSIPEIGPSEGNGIIFHWHLPDKGWKVQLLIDHSLTIPDGLFIQFLLFFAGDSIDYSRLAFEGRALLDTALNKLGLEIADANRS